MEATVKYVAINNIITVLCTAAVVLTIFAATHSLHALWALLILVNVSSFKHELKEKQNAGRA